MTHPSPTTPNSFEALQRRVIRWDELCTNGGRSESYLIGEADQIMCGLLEVITAMQSETAHIVQVLPLPPQPATITTTTPAAAAPSDAETLADKIEGIQDDGGEGVPWSQDELDLMVKALRAMPSAVAPIGEQIARDAARDLDGVASHIMAGESLNYEAARVITSGARMLERLAKSAHSAKLRSDDWHDELLLRWCEWTGGHLSDQNFLRTIHDIVNDNLLPGSMRAPDSGSAKK